MKLLIKQTGTTFSLIENQALRIGNSSECQVQINHPQVWGCHASIEENPFGYVLKVESSPFLVNGVEIKERCLVYAGDVLSLADIRLLLVDDAYVPVAVKSAEGFSETTDAEQQSSVFGLRALNGDNSGAFMMQNFKHDSGWTIHRSDSELIFAANDADVLVNGQTVESAVLQNGDRLSRGKERFQVDSPGHSGFSKFSPSHPRNVQLSESLQEGDELKPTNSRLHRINPHLWWITLVAGLVVIAAIILMTV